MNLPEELYWMKEYAIYVFLPQSQQHKETSPTAVTDITKQHHQYIGNSHEA